MVYLFALLFVAEKKKHELRLELPFWLIAWDGYMQAAAILKQVGHICSIFDESAIGSTFVVRCQSCLPCGIRA